MDFTQEEWKACLKVLQTLSKDPSQAPDVLRFKGLITKIHRKAKKQIRKENKLNKRIEDNALRQSTFIHQQNKPAELSTLKVSIPLVESTNYNKAIYCYVCKQKYSRVQGIYPQLCPSCTEENTNYRNQGIELKGRKVLLTGGRIKIGYELALKLLRDGAIVHLTTRFPKNAEQRYKGERDYLLWKERLFIHQVDFRFIEQVEYFCTYLLKELDSLDIIINNAAQTIARPHSFYESLYAQEKDVLTEEKKEHLGFFSPTSPLIHLKESANIFTAYLDKYGQALDLRENNSWRLRLDEVSTRELVEVQLINTIAPYIINARLKSLLLNSPFSRKFIVNVSAMEGQFNRKSKTVYHPHTNMAKAALNMMTRTAGADYAKDNIFMTSVDTGWVTDENPAPKRLRHFEQKDFTAPLDCIDGAARIYHPIVHGVQEEHTPYYGVFLKDYKIYSW